MSNTKEFFAALPTDEIGPELNKRVRDWYSHIVTSGQFSRMKDSYNTYYGTGFTGNTSEITKSGVQGELSLIKVNHFRNLIQHMLIMCTSTRPNMQARALNTDYRSQAQTILANGILDYYLKEKDLETHFKDAAEIALVFGEGFVSLEWDAQLGSQYDIDPETGQTIFTGDLRYRTHTPIDVIKDLFLENVKEQEWLMVRYWKNKFSLAAKYPDLEEEIINLAVKSDEGTPINFFNRVSMSTELVPVYVFYAQKSDALPEGRQVVFCDDDVILFDGPLPYHEIPVYRIAPGNYIGNPFGYTVAFDLLALQQAYDAMFSTVLTNQATFGVQSIMTPIGRPLSVSQLNGGMNLIQYDPASGPPQALQLTKTAPEIFDFIKVIEQTMESISGVNSVARGDPAASLRSGSALALVQSMAIQFNTGLQQSYAQLIEAVGTATINTLKDFAAAPRIALITGRANASMVKEFCGADLDQIDRVIVDIGNPLAACLAIDTPVLMYDGSIKKVQNVKVGDRLMGPDSLPRTVESTAVGQEEMYEIYHSKINPEFLYTCNESHILSLQYCSNDGRYGLKQYEKIDVSVREYLKWPKRKQRLFMGYRTGVEFKEQDLPMPAYQFGLWLGDGTSETPALTTMDNEIRDAWSSYANAVGMNIRVQAQPNNKSSVYFITSGQKNGSSGRNPVKNALTDLNVINNKHVPEVYKINSRKNRLELLAGFIDTDGSLIDETFVITQKNDLTTEGIIFIARSLGFKVTCKKIKGLKRSARGKDIKEYYNPINKITIGGNTWEIPTRLPRKQAKKKDKARAWLNYCIEVRPKEYGTYYGFTLKEEPHFLLGDFTVTHNTTAGKMEIATNLVQQGLITTPQEYLTVMDTGNLDPLKQNEQSQLELIHRENENLADGRPVHAVAVDQHVMHIEEHTAVLNSPEIRENPQITGAVLDHINQHINLLRTTDPGLLQILKQPSLPPPPPPPGSQPPPGAPGPQGPAPQGPQNGPPQNPPQGAPGPQSPPPGAPPSPMPNLPNHGPVAVVNGANRGGSAPVNMPQLPKNPLTKQRWNPKTGGLNR